MEHKISCLAFSNFHITVQKYYFFKRLNCFLLYFMHYKRRMKNISTGKNLELYKNNYYLEIHRLLFCRLSTSNSSRHVPVEKYPL